MEDRVVTFSIKPEDNEALELLKLLKAHSKRTGISFSYFMVSALKKKTKELKLK